MATAIDMHNIVRSSEIYNIIKASAQSLIDNPSMAHALPPIMLRGAPGVGKSTIIRHVADELGVGFIDIRLSEMERVDVAGLPSVENGTTKWNVPSLLPQDPNSKGIILLDEITAAPSDVQVAAYQLVLDRCISNSNYKLPDGWYIVAAGNRTEDRAVAKTMSSALANRFMHFELEANVEDWIDWAVSHSIHPSIVGYIKYRPENLFKMKNQNLECGWPSPRSWERVSNVLPLYSKNETVLQKVVYGLIGNAVGVEFTAFHKLNKSFDDVLDILTNPKAKIVVPSKADECWALCSAAVYLLWSGKSDAETKKRVDGFFRLCDKLSSDFLAMMVKSAMLGNATVPRIKAMTFLLKNANYKKLAAKLKLDKEEEVSL